MNSSIWCTIICIWLLLFEASLSILLPLNSTYGSLIFKAIQSKEIAYERIEFRSNEVIDGNMIEKALQTPIKTQSPAIPYVSFPTNYNEYEYNSPTGTTQNKSETPKINNTISPNTQSPTDSLSIVSPLNEANESLMLKHSTEAIAHVIIGNTSDERIELSSNEHLQTQNNIPLPFPTLIFNEQPRKQKTPSNHNGYELNTPKSVEHNSPTGTTQNKSETPKGNKIFMELNVNNTISSNAQSPTDSLSIVSPLNGVNESLMLKHSTEAIVHDITVNTLDERVELSSNEHLKPQNNIPLPFPTLIFNEQPRKQKTTSDHNGYELNTPKSVEHNSPTETTQNKSETPNSTSLPYILILISLVYHSYSINKTNVIVILLLIVLYFNGCASECVSTLTLGGWHACALFNTGKIKCWGYNGLGQLGLGNFDNRGNVPNTMGANLTYIDLGDGVIVKQIEAGSNHNCVILQDSRIKCFGFNGFGQLGYGDIYNRGGDAADMGQNLTYVNVGLVPGVNAIQLAVGVRNDHNCILLNNGKIKCFGYNWYGQLGYEDQNNRGDGPGEMDTNLIEVDLGTNVSVISVANGQYFTCGLLNSLKVKCWGRSNRGQLGYGDMIHRGDGPGEMGNMLPEVNFGYNVSVISIVTGREHVCTILMNGKIKCWGGNKRGQLGYGDTKHRGNKPGEMGTNLTEVDLGTNVTVTKLALGSYHTCALLTGGAVKCFGYNFAGQLGYGDTENRGDGVDEMGTHLPQIDLGSGVTAIDIFAGESFTCAMLSNRDVKCWGDNRNGQLGLGDDDNRGDGVDEMGDKLPALELTTTPCTLAPTTNPTTNPTTLTANPTTNPTTRTANPTKDATVSMDSASDESIESDESSESDESIDYAYLEVGNKIGNSDKNGITNVTILVSENMFYLLLLILISLTAILFFCVCNKLQS